MSRVFVTGGGGVVGGAILERLVARGDDVVALARSDDAAQAVAARGVTVVRGDNDLITFAANEGFRWQCHYDNPDQTTIYWGESAADNEMCYFCAYYFPSVGHFISGNPMDQKSYMAGCWQ